MIWLPVDYAFYPSFDLPSSSIDQMEHRIKIPESLNNIRLLVGIGANLNP
jgi:hypothetical protein